MFSFEMFNSVLVYDPETGVVKWRVNSGRWGRLKAGVEAGSVTLMHGNFYRKVRVYGRLHFSHRIAWLLTKCVWPTHQIDHIDGNGLNNRLDNLRDVIQVENGRNQKRRSSNTSGITGVHWDTTTGKWRSVICVDGKQKNLGRFSNAADAAAARQVANEQYGFSKRHGMTLIDRIF